VIVLLPKLTIMVKNKLVLTLNSILIHKQSEKDGDELYLKHNGKKIAPLKDKFIHVTSPEIKLNTQIEVGSLGEWIEVELWEYDYLLPNKLLGTFKLLTDAKGGPFIADLQVDSNEKARYSVNWELGSKKLKVATVL
jgi:hypothetical protein